MNWKLIKIFKRFACIRRSIISINWPLPSVFLLLFLSLISSIISPVYGMNTIDGTISVKQEDNVPFKIIYTINIMATTDSMPLTSISLLVGPDINDRSINSQYTIKDVLNKNLIEGNRIYLKNNSNVSILIPVDFSSSRLSAGDFANWVSNINGSNYWDKAWCRAEIIPLVGDAEIIEVIGKPFFVKSGYLAEDSEIVEIRTDQYPQVDLVSPPNMQDFYSSNLSPNVGIIFEYKPSDDVCLKNCTLYINNEASFPPEESPENNKSYTFKRNLNLTGNYTWHIKCCDNEGKCNNSDIRNLDVNYDSPPVVRLIPQKNASFEINMPVEFRCIVHDDQKIQKCSLYIDNICVNDSPIIIEDEYVFTHTFTDIEDIGEHEWHVLCCDNSLQCSKSLGNLSLSVVLPSILYVIPEDVVYVQKYIMSDHGTKNIYSSISEAIGDLPSGGTIKVMGCGMNSEYIEKNITIYKPMNLIGVNYPIIKGDNMSYSLVIKSDNVTIHGFNIENSKIGIYATIEDNNLNYSDINISDNMLMGGEYGICLDGYKNLRNITIINNIIADNLYGLTLYCPQISEPDVELMECGNIIFNNSITGCRNGIGIHLESCPQVHIFQNILHNNTRSIYVKDSQSGLISDNNISESNVGITKCNSNIKIESNIFSMNGQNEVLGCL